MVVRAARLTSALARNRFPPWSSGAVGWSVVLNGCRTDEPTTAFLDAPEVVPAVYLQRPARFTQLEGLDELLGRKDLLGPSETTAALGPASADRERVRRFKVAET